MNNIEMVKEQLWQEVDVLARRVEGILVALNALGSDVEAESKRRGIGNYVLLDESSEPEAALALSDAGGSMTDRQEPPRLRVEPSRIVDELPDTGGEWFPSLFTKKGMFRAEIMASAIAKAEREADGTLSKSAKKKLTDRASNWLTRNEESGAVKATGKSGDRRYTLVAKR
jgi:hypothetical protein